MIHKDQDSYQALDQNMTVTLESQVNFKDDSTSSTLELDSETIATIGVKLKNEIKLDDKEVYKREIVWKNVLLFLILHGCGFYGIYIGLTQTKSIFRTVVTMEVLFFLIGLGTTAGSHRLWTHKSYKASRPLRVFLMIMQAAAGQNDVIEWSRDHRVHHKFSETDADPHNIKRGFFFAHMGWLLCKKHPLVKKLGKTVDMSDLENDPILQFQRKYYHLLFLIFAVAFPTLTVYYVLDETLWASFFIGFWARYLLFLHGTWTVNSIAHLYGDRPYDKKIQAVESSFTSCLTFGEGFHNYHHAFPWDYKAAEARGIPWFSYGTTAFIELMEKLGLATDLRAVPPNLILKRRLTSGRDHVDD